MRRVRLFLLAAAGMLLLAVGNGCVVVREYTPDAKVIKASQLEYDLARELLTAFIKDDAKGFVALLPEDTRSKFTVDSFRKTRKSVVESAGEPVGFTYLTTLKLGTLNPQIWKVEFRRYNVNRSKEYTSEILFKVVTGMISEKEAVITGFQFL